MVNYSIHREKAGAVIKKMIDAGIPFSVRTLEFISVSEEDEKAVDRIMRECGLIESDLI